MGFSQNSFFFAVLFKSILRSRFICIFFVSAKKNNTFLSKTTLYILMEDDKISLAKVQHIKVLTIFNKKKVKWEHQSHRLHCYDYGLQRVTAKSTNIENDHSSSLLRRWTFAFFFVDIFCDIFFCFFLFYGCHTFFTCIIFVCHFITVVVACYPKKKNNSYVRVRWLNRRLWFLCACYFNWDMTTMTFLHHTLSQCTQSNNRNTRVNPNERTRKTIKDNGE